MGRVARGVHSEGGKVIGVLPEFFKKKDIEYSDADELIVTPDMRTRKDAMDKRSDAFIVLPGGIGTLEEAMEILSMKQLKLTQKPLVFIDQDGYFEGLLAHLKEMVGHQFAKPATLELFKTVPNPQTALKYILQEK